MEIDISEIKKEKITSIRFADSAIIIFDTHIASRIVIPSFEKDDMTVQLNYRNIQISDIPNLIKALEEVIKIDKLRGE